MIHSQKYDGGGDEPDAFCVDWSTIAKDRSGGRANLGDIDVS